MESLLHRLREEDEIEHQRITVADEPEVEEEDDFDDDDEDDDDEDDEEPPSAGEVIKRDE